MLQIVRCALLKQIAAHGNGKKRGFRFHSGSRRRRTGKVSEMKKTMALLIAAFCLFVCVTGGVAEEMETIESAFQTGFYAYFAGDYETAFTKLQYAADHGHDEALFYLGCMYLSGIGAEQNVEKGIELFEQAAALGNITACEALGELFAGQLDEESIAHGITVEPDLEKSHFYYQLAEELKMKSEE